MIYKVSKNPLQKAMKLIMNSAYGKFIQKFNDRDWKFFHERNELNKFLFKNSFKTIENVLINVSDIHTV